MKYVDEFRDKRLIGKVAAKIREAACELRSYTFMEVCGTHTMSIFRFGLNDLLPKNIKLISGPGCPVCVTPNEYLDRAIELARSKDIIVATFGDMLRVHGAFSSLEKEKASGCSIKMVYSSLDALELAVKNPSKEIIFLGVGFETTAPTVAASILKAKKNKIRNYSVLCGHKTMPEVLGRLVKDKRLKLDGFLLPGHVSIVTGSCPYRFLSSVYKKGTVVAGFEPLDILQAILMLVTQKTPKTEIQYTRIIKDEGNPLARQSIKKVFKKTSSVWRGIGRVDQSGLKIKKEYSAYDAELKFKIKARPSKENPNCICGDVLKGIKRPTDCKLFKKVCKPENPVGACMVSSEGTCAAYYRYG